MIFFRKTKKLVSKKEIKPKCPECGNRKFNREVRQNVWVCGSCMSKFIVDPKAKPVERPKEEEGDVKDYEFGEYY